ncbi:MAG TPA: ferrochelatase [Pirellulales bacterium]|jgi:ferrochelatase|nr:ferrochelatase [Pirellulales bacterium]
MNSPPYDALLVVSFGGPEGPDEVVPFLENVLRGKNVPRERMLAVAEHYRQFGGSSPINAQNRALIAALEQELAVHGPRLPIYFGNRNWRPLLPDTLRQMAADGIRRAAAFFTSAYSSYSGCRQYRENIAAAQAEVGASAPQVEKLRVFFNHPGFIEPMIERVAAAFERIPAERRELAGLVFTAHSIPLAMAQSCAYESQLREASRLVAEAIGRSQWDVVFQSRSGPPNQSWLEPDIGAWLESAHARGMRGVVVAPVGFISDHLEVVYDLDIEAQQKSRELGLSMQRAATVGTHPRFIRMIRELLVERMTPGAERPALGTFGPSHDICPLDCCLPGTPARR